MARTTKNTLPTEDDAAALAAGLIAAVGSTTPEPVADDADAVDVHALLASHAAAVETARAAADALKASNEAIAAVIRGARESMGLTRPPLARKAGMTIAQLAGIELGREATKDELRNLGRALNIEALADLA